MRPLANRLGIQAIKSELEDLSFAVLHPKIYVEIQSLIAQRTPQREIADQVVEEIDEDLRDLRIRGTVVGRPKQLYSVYQKMVVQGSRVRRHLRPHRHPCDRRLCAGLLCGSRRDSCAVDAAARALQGLHRDAEVQPLPVAAHNCDRPGRTHGQDQIRTQEMHQQAEYGVAAHWMYKADERRQGRGACS